jgi:hypothetical protein
MVPLAYFHAYRRACCVLLPSMQSNLCVQAFPLSGCGMRTAACAAATAAAKLGRHLPSARAAAYSTSSTAAGRMTGSELPSTQLSEFTQRQLGSDVIDFSAGQASTVGNTTHLQPTTLWQEHNLNAPFSSRTCRNASCVAAAVPACWYPASKILHWTHALIKQQQHPAHSLLPATYCWQQLTHTLYL